MEHVEQVRFGDQLYAIIVRASFREPGIHFFSTPELSQQLAFMSHPEGKSIAPHRHNKVTREVHYTQEVLLIQKGKLQVDFYTVAEEAIWKAASWARATSSCSAAAHTASTCSSRSRCSRSSKVPIPARTTRPAFPK